MPAAVLAGCVVQCTCLSQTPTALYDTALASLALSIGAGRRRARAVARRAREVAQRRPGHSEAGARDRAEGAIRVVELLLRVEHQRHRRHAPRDWDSCVLALHDISDGNRPIFDARAVHDAAALMADAADVLLLPGRQHVPAR